MILSTFHQKWLISQCWWGDPLYFLVVWQRSLLCFIIFLYDLPTFSCLLEFVFIFIRHFQWFIKVPSCCFFAAINFFFHEFIDSIFSSVYLNWLPVLVITTTNYFVTISTVCMFLICFSVWFIIVCCLVQMCESFLLLFQNLHRWWNVLVIVCENDWISVHYCLYQVVIT